MKTCGYRLCKKPLVQKKFEPHDKFSKRFHCDRKCRRAAKKVVTISRAELENHQQRVNEALSQWRAA